MQEPLDSNRASQLFLQNYDFVRMVAFRKAPCRSFQDDIVHDVYIEFINNAGKWVIDETGPRPLLRTITQNIALQYWRRWMRELPEPFRVLSQKVWDERSEKMLPEDLLFEEQMAAIDVCLKKLASEQRELVERFYLKGLSGKELSHHTGQKSGTIYSLLSRIRTRLHDCVLKVIEMEVDDV